jgi:hypothetical protein
MSLGRLLDMSDPMVSPSIKVCPSRYYFYQGACISADNPTVTAEVDLYSCPARAIAQQAAPSWLPYAVGGVALVVGFVAGKIL